MERDVGDPPADGTLNNVTRTATDLLSVQRTLGSREQSDEKRPMPHPAHLRNRHNEEEGKVFVGRHPKILRLDQDPHSTALPKKKKVEGIKVGISKMTRKWVHMLTLCAAGCVMRER